MSAFIPSSLYGVIGWPLAQSLSPLLHNTAFQALGIPAAYMLWELPPEKLPRFVDSMRLLGIRGCSVTLPHKVEILPLLDHRSERVELMGAANTLYWRDDRLCGENTDVTGFLRSLGERVEALSGDVLLLVSDTDWVKACTALGQVRLDIARKHGLIDPDKFNFLWVVDFPLFEYSEQEGRWMAMHHPFTLPKAEDLDKVESDPGACHAVAYDIVLNGVEMGGGSMRINDPALQDRMFHALGFTEEKARESFGFLMDAYKFGAPPHGGMAYGLDRMVMLMLKKDSIRDVIAFPKVQNAGEPMSGAPDVVDEQQLKDLSIALTLKD